MSSDKPRLLYVVHQYLTPGGTEIQTQLLAEGLAGQYEITVVYLRMLDGSVRVAALRPDGQSSVHPADAVVFPLTPYRQPTTEASFEEILRYVRPEIIHFHHFIYWPISVIDQALASGARVVVTLHDYYAITPNFTALHPRMGHVVDPLKTLSAEYSRRTFGEDVTGYLLVRRQAIARSLANVHRRVVVSDYLRRVMHAVFPLDFKCIEPGIILFEPLPGAPGAPALRFGYTGTLVEQKGWESLVAAFQKVRQQYPDTALRLYGASLAAVPLPAGVTHYGGYTAADLPRILSEFDVGVIPSLFAETFSIVLSEMWHGGRPVAVADIGALGERVTDGVNGKKFVPGDVDSIARSLIWFIENNDWRTWRLPKVRSVTALTADHVAMYRSLL